MTNEEQETLVEETVAPENNVPSFNQAPENSMGLTTAGDPIAPNSYAGKTLAQALILQASSSITALANMEVTSDSEARIVDLAKQLNQAIVDSHNPQ